jgi:hypothetical protein
MIRVMIKSRPRVDGLPDPAAGSPVGGRETPSAPATVWSDRPAIADVVAMRLRLYSRVSV